MQIRRSLLAVLTLCLFIGMSPAFAFDGLGPKDKGFDVQAQVFSLVHQRWMIVDMLIKLQENPSTEAQEKYNKELDIFKENGVELGKRIINSLEDPNREVIELVSAIYKSMDSVGRQSLYDALGYIKTSCNVEFQSRLSDKEFRDYFPGYGYSDPGYKYRKGHEVSREFKGNLWQYEEHTITSTFQVDLTVSLDVLGMLKGYAANGTIKNLTIGDQSEMNVGGTPMICVKVSFQIVKSLVTKTNRKFDVNKIWFELLRSKDSGWGNSGTWELCGQTYEIINEATGEAVTTEVKPSN
ncbi:MAG: hypothetical protein HQM09_11320 [Candidatus Riflebacteria bacterium]|nr:hypothetical protein [Candidatus Riflebacteria bacterium]